MRCCQKPIATNPFFRCGFLTPLLWMALLMWAPAPAHPVSFGNPFLVKDIVPGGASLHLIGVIEFGNGYLLLGRNPVECRDGFFSPVFEVWQTDGTKTGTHELVDCQGDFQILGLSANRDLAYFALGGLDLRDRSHSLWRTDGTPEGTTSFATNLAAEQPGRFVGSSDRYVFLGSPWEPDPLKRDREVWVTDGTNAGTHELVDLSSQGQVSPVHFVRYDGDVYFAAHDDLEGTPRSGLWRTDGTATGTLFVGAPPDGGIRDLAQAGGLLWLGATEITEGATLWKSDGKPEGTERLMSFGTPTFLHENFRFYDVGWNHRILLVVQTDDVPGSLWVSNGQSGDTVKLIADFDLTESGEVRRGFRPLALGSWVYFLRHMGKGTSLWRTNGTPEGTGPAPNLCVAECTYEIQRVHPVEGRELLVLELDNGVHGREPWISDGTAEGTKLLADVCPGACSSRTGRFRAVGDAVLFFGQSIAGPEPGESTQVWASNLETQKARKLTGFEHVEAGWGPLTGAPGLVLVVGDDGQHGTELWAIPIMQSVTEIPSLSSAGLLLLILLLSVLGWITLTRFA